jgi:hypothetical protein
MWPATPAPSAAAASLNPLLLEPRIHDGVDRAWLLNFDWTP